MDDSLITFDEVIESYYENIDENKMVGNMIDYEKVCNSCIIYVVLFIICLIISLSITSAHFNFHWYLNRKYTKTTIY